MEASSGLKIFARLLALIPFGKLFAVQCKHEVLAYSLRKSICSFQKTYTKYHYVSADRHMKFKKELQSAEQNDSNDSLNSAHDELNKCVNENLAPICSEFSEHIRKYFFSTRVSVKDHIRIGIYLYNEDNGMLENILSKDSPARNPADYSMFDDLTNQNKEAYLDNCIPKTVIDNSDYKNEDLDKIQIATKYLSFIDKILGKDSLIRSRLFRSDSYQQCKKWDDCKITPLKEGQSSYKCHIAVPITFRSHFTDKLNYDDSLSQLGIFDSNDSTENERKILGIIVVDYFDSHFFDKTTLIRRREGNTDINTLYQFADLLSLCLLVNRNYYQNSTSVKRYISDL